MSYIRQGLAGGGSVMLDEPPAIDFAKLSKEVARRQRVARADHLRKVYFEQYGVTLPLMEVCDVH